MKLKNYMFTLLVCFVGWSISAQQPIENTNDKFLEEVFSSRMVATNEAKLAVKIGSTPAIRAYGAEMIKDQNTLYAEIKKIASGRNILFPKSVNYISAQGRESLTGKKGTDFDLSYKQNTKADLEKDITLFKQASNSNDISVSEFANKFLPMLESHLAQVKSL